MNKGLLIGFVVYYALMSLVFIIGNSVGLFNDFSSNIDINSINSTGLSTVNPNPVENILTFLARFVGWVFFGVGLPSDTPTFFSVPFVVFQVVVTILFIAFIISSIYNG